MVLSAEFELVISVYGLEILFIRILLLSSERRQDTEMLFIYFCELTVIFVLIGIILFILALTILLCQVTILSISMLFYFWMSVICPKRHQSMRTMKNKNKLSIYVHFASSSLMNVLDSVWKGTSNKVLKLRCWNSKTWTVEHLSCYIYI